MVGADDDLRQAPLDMPGNRSNKRNTRPTMTANTTDTDGSDTRPTVLVVEDEQDLADMYARWLSESYTVETAYDGETALAALDEETDVVMLDRRMPGTSGDDVLAYVREQGLDVRVAIVSAVTPSVDVIDMGFDDYLVKPVDDQQLHETVERMLTRAEYDETLQELHQLLATSVTLQAENEEAALKDSEAFTELQERIRSLVAEADELVEDLPADELPDEYRR